MWTWGRVVGGKGIKEDVEQARLWAVRRAGAVAVSVSRN